MQRGQQIQSLQSQINMTGDMKAVAELQARIQSENAQVANDANRLAIMKAMGEAQQQAIAQAGKERELKMLATNAPAAIDTFRYVPRPGSGRRPD
jgi:type IV secretion system protein VirB5